MAHKHLEAVPSALEGVLACLGELEVVLGTQVTPVLAGIRSTLIAAMAARDRGDVPGAVEHVAQAMDRLGHLADRLDATDAALMRAVAENFRAALLRGDPARAEESAQVMMRKSGARERTGRS